MVSLSDPKIGQNHQNRVPEAVVRAPFKNSPKIMECEYSPDFKIRFRAIGVSKINTKISSNWRPYAFIFNASGTIFCKKCLPEGYQKMHWKSYPKNIKKGLVFQGGLVPKIIKIGALGSKCGPSLQERFPRIQNTQKSSKNTHPDLQNHPKSWRSGNSRSRKSWWNKFETTNVTMQIKNNGTVAGYARNALDILDMFGYI